MIFNLSTNILLDINLGMLFLVESLLFWLHQWAFGEVRGRSCLSHGRQEAERECEGVSAPVAFLLSCVLAGALANRWLQTPLFWIFSLGRYHGSDLGNPVIVTPKTASLTPTGLSLFKLIFGRNLTFLKLHWSLVYILCSKNKNQKMSYLLLVL